VPADVGCGRVGLVEDDVADLEHDVRCRVADGGEVESDLAKVGRVLVPKANRLSTADEARSASSMRSPVT